MFPMYINVPIVHQKKRVCLYPELKIQTNVLVFNKKLNLLINLNNVTSQNF